MRPAYVRVMDVLYVACMVVAIVSIVSMTILIFVGVIMRYIFYMGAAFAEPSSIFFAVQLTFYGAAACYRARAHLRIQFFAGLLPTRLQWIPDALVKLLMAIIAVAMIYYGADLVQTTWFQAYPEFTYIRVGAVYSAIPGGGLVLLLFVIESVFFPNAMEADEEEEVRRALEHAEEEARKLGY
jgi:TRAP-type transport system small permease protein